jgi:hypothetical protein
MPAQRTRMPDRPTDTLSTLQDVLAAATRIAQDLSGDRLLPRLLDVFARMPEEDRETILNVLEREVDHRLLTKEAPTAALSGLNITKPNPNARLYLRLADNEPPPYVSSEEVAQSILRASRVVHRARERGHDLRTTWGPTIVEALRRVGEEERETLRGYHRTILELLEEAERPTH